MRDEWTLAAPCRRYVLRAKPLHFGELVSLFGWPAPERLLRAKRTGERSTLWLGPDEWLLRDASTAALDAGACESAQTTAWPHSLVEVSDRQVALDIAEPLATDLLAAACPLDLESFAVDDCTRTVFGRCEIVLWRTDESCFRLECGRSYLPYVQSMLRAAL